MEKGIIKLPLDSDEDEPKEAEQRKIERQSLEATE